MSVPSFDSNQCFALCRLPQQEEALRVVGTEVVCFERMDDIPEREAGFIIAPFEANAKNPIYIIQNPTIETFVPADSKEPESSVNLNSETCREDYSKAFEKVTRALTNGRCDKVVLARKVTAKGGSTNMTSLFEKACKRYPYCFICAFNLPGQGAWLTATPELLYRQQGGVGQTMALAGTMLWSDLEQGAEWTAKDQKEQQLVADFIKKTLQDHQVDCTMDERHVARAGHLGHLCNVVEIAQTNTPNALTMLKALHPTPAIGGIPRAEALNVIAESEGQGNREYYAGFTGFLNTPDYGTQCYVSLRMMHMHPNNDITLYAGGGILPESNEQREWHETEIKLQTIAKLL